MDLLIPFALKSLLIAGATLGLLHLLRGRSAAERSMVAHFGLLALLLVPIGALVLPQLVFELPLLSADGAPVAPSAVNDPSAAVFEAPSVAADAGELDVLQLWPLVYGFPAAILVAVTLLAVLRLLALRARASVLVDPTWLSALAHAQHRMNFKHGTALLSSSDLKSPISWGVMRPVILLNDEAIEAHGQAEAIIAHELAHVRGLDWAKLLLGRIAVAIFWFNPLVWMLAREAHQLREETADDAVLAADVAGPDYAELLVGVARHDCKGLLLASHGVAPGKGSLTRRVRRVLDASLPRTPVARGFGAGVALGVIATAAPLAAVTFTGKAASADPSRPYYVSAPRPTDSLPSVVADSMAGATAVTTEMVSSQVAAALTGREVDSPEFEKAVEKQAERRLALASAHPYAAAEPAAPAVSVDHWVDAVVERAASIRATGLSPDYAARIRAAAPRLSAGEGELLALKAVGVSPEWLKEMVRAGYAAKDVGDVVGARAAGVSPAYVRDLAAAGYRNVPLDDLAGLRAAGVNGNYIRRLRAAGMTGLSVDKLIELRARGIKAHHRPSGDWPVRPPHTPDVDYDPPEPPEPPEAD
ncbi:M56 family metallopeptidase [Sphingomonas sp. GCM10030256]|uniref:M56 family metallopeptidase n=1 Tax=Sphingomonas sp. GCM10030256 TaxID=3273427 RepID=UPI003607A99D